MKIEKVGCDQCGTETTDKYTVKGWIHIAGAITISINRKQGKGDACCAFIDKDPNGLDFCCLTCLNTFLNNTINKKLGKKLGTKQLK